MSEKDFQAKKKFGQHFLKSDSVIQKIVNNQDDSTKYCLEIGPGPGILTKFLVDKDAPLKVIEIDDQFISHLKQLVGDENVTHQDAMEVELEELFKQWSWTQDIWLVSNLPYNVAAPLMIRFFPIMPIQKMTLMMQKEMALRILPPNKKKQSNPLAIYSALFFDVNTLCQAPPGAFSPPPKVDSTVLTFTRKEKPLIDPDEYSSFLKFGRGMFATPRKQLKKVLKTNLSLPSGQNWETLFKENDIPETVRAEALDLEKVLALYFSWKRCIS
jgi:16S rRNA (adenine1518-N6/adenine1519-N6)-dimethyltransferase